MSTMTDEKATLPEGGEWAIGSLLDKSNVGKYVWAGNDGRGKWSPERIAKIGRTNIHVSRYGQTTAYRVHPDIPTQAGAEYGAMVQTDKYRSERAERNELLGVLPTSWSRVSTDKLRRIVAILDEDEVTP